MKFLTALRFWHPQQFATVPDDVLVITKDRFGPSDAENLCGLLTLLGLAGHALLVRFFGRVESPADVWVPAVLWWVYLAGAIGALVWALRRWRQSLGQWRIDAGGIAFSPRVGPPRSLGWEAVTRVRWRRPPIHLVGAADRFRLDRDGLPDATWTQVLDRIEAHLAPRFDLAIKSLPNIDASPVSLDRIGTVIAPAALVILASTWVAIRRPERSGLVFGGGCLLVGGYLAFCLIPVLRRLHRRDWHEPRGSKLAADPELA